jgi:hypothetical protein
MNREWELKKKGIGKNQWFKIQMVHDDITKLKINHSGILKDRLEIKLREITFKRWSSREVENGLRN